MNRLFTLLLISFPLCALQLKAQTSVVTVGLRGGGQYWLATPVAADGLTQDNLPTAPGTNGTIQNTFGGTGVLDVRYTFYGNMNDYNALGFSIGGGIGIGSTHFNGHAADRYTNMDYDGEKMDYYTEADFHQRERCYTGEVSLLLSGRFSNVTVNIGPRLVMPFATEGRFFLEKARIEAFYPAYGVQLINETITGSLSTPYDQESHVTLPKCNVEIAAEIGYEWNISERNTLGLQAFADVGLWNNYNPSQIAGKPLIQVAPISDPDNPVPSVTVGSVNPLIASFRHVDFGVRLYVGFTVSSLKKGRKANYKPGLDSRTHRNRIFID